MYILLHIPFESDKIAEVYFISVGRIEGSYVL